MGIVPGGGGSGTTHRRQGVSPGRIVKHLPRGPDRPAINPRQRELERRFVDQKAGLEIVRPIEDQVDAVAQSEHIGGGHVGHDRLNLDRRIDFLKLIAAAIAFGSPAATSASS